MAETSTVPTKVHLVGSIGLDSVPEIFKTVGKLLGRRLQRVPDGEPGGRRQWIGWQFPLFLSSPFLAQNAVEPGTSTSTVIPTRFSIAEGVRPEDIRFGELGYAREARASYLDFIAARKKGLLPKKARFQVCLPTPFAVVAAFSPGKDLFAVEKSYEKSMRKEVESLCREIPHKDLCIQWDICIEVLMWDSGSWRGVPSPFQDIEREVMARMKRLCAPIPKAVELGFHLCYGDMRAKHSVNPADAGKLVEISNALVKAVRHPIAYIHMPVPADREDEGFFRPLANLRLKPGTELYLGLVHADDERAEGTKQRIAAAGKYASGFGIATECGMARARTPETVLKLLRAHALASQEPAAARGK